MWRSHTHAYDPRWKNCPVPATAISCWHWYYKNPTSLSVRRKVLPQGWNLRHWVTSLISNKKNTNTIPGKRLRSFIYLNSPIKQVLRRGSFFFYVRCPYILRQEDVSLLFFFFFLNLVLIFQSSSYSVTNSGIFYVMLLENS